MKRDRSCVAFCVYYGDELYSQMIEKKVIVNTYDVHCHSKAAFTQIAKRSGGQNLSLDIDSTAGT